MLKTVSSITNALGALNYKGTWDANANSPALASSVGTKGDYYVVSVAGSTTLNGISNWGVGDWAAYNGSVWQRVEGGADLNGVNLSVSGTTTLSGLTASTALALDASKNVVSVTNTGTGDNVLATAPTLVGNVTLSTGNLVVADTKGIDFSATPGTGTSELLADYEEGVWTPTFVPNSGANFTSVTYNAVTGGKYTKVGKIVHVQCVVRTDAITVGSASGALCIGGLPFAAVANTTGRDGYSTFCAAQVVGWTGTRPLSGSVSASESKIVLWGRVLVTGDASATGVTDLGTGAAANYIELSGTYISV